MNNKQLFELLYPVKYTYIQLGFVPFLLFKLTFVVYALISHTNRRLCNVKPIVISVEAFPIQKLYCDVKILARSDGQITSRFQREVTFKFKTKWQSFNVQLLRTTPIFPIISQPSLFSGVCNTRQLDLATALRQEYFPLLKASFFFYKVPVRFSGRGRSI